MSVMKKSSAPKTIAIIGAGGRGRVFTSIIGDYKHLGRVVAVAEPRDEYRQAVAAAAKIPPAMQFKTWQEFVARPRLCDAAVIATMDRDHKGPAVACLKKGYDLLLEKPLAPTLADCRAIEAAQRKSGRLVSVCHSMRYQKGLTKLKDLVAGGLIGDIVSMDQLEPVAHWHQAHSFVRGNWGNTSRSAFMLLAKSCHDIDYIAYLVGKPCVSVSSFGALSYFRRENAPRGAPVRCTDGCPAEFECPYSAYKAYVYTDKREGWPANVVSFDHSQEAHLEAIRTGPYGRCVFRCDNDAVDHQVAAMLFENDITATFTMTAFGGGGRQIRVHGTKGEIKCSGDTITARTFADNNTTAISIGAEAGGHGGGDNRVVRLWLMALQDGDDRKILTNAQESLRTHTIVFAAEKSRLEKRTIRIADM